MIKKEQQEAIVELISDVVCDVTKKSLFAKETPDGFVEICTLTYFKISKEDVINGDYEGAVEMESSELSREIYDKLIKILRDDMGGEVPSQYENAFESDDEESIN